MDVFDTLIYSLTSCYYFQIMDVVSYYTFLYDISFLRVRLNLGKVTRFFIKDGFYKNRLNFCTFKVGGVGWKVSGDGWR